MGGFWPARLFHVVDGGGLKLFRRIEKLCSRWGWEAAIENPFKKSGGVRVKTNIRMDGAARLSVPHLLHDDFVRKPRKPAGLGGTSETGKKVSLFQPKRVSTQSS